MTHVHLLDPYHQRDSILHRLDARIKLILTLLVIFCIAAMPAGAWPGYLLLFGLILSTEILSELNVVFYLRRALLALPFILAAAPLIFSGGDPTLGQWKVGGIWIAISQPGIERFASLMLKSWLSLQAAMILTTTTPFPELLAAMRSLRLPRILVAVVSLMWRYLFVLMDEVFRLNRARQARSGAEPGHQAGGTLVWRASVTGGMAGSLFLRSYERGDRIYQAMLARGYDGEIRTLPAKPLDWRDGVILAAGIVLVAGILWMSFAFWGR